MKSSRFFVFLSTACRQAGSVRLSDMKTLWRALVACLLFFSLMGAGLARAQIFQFAENDANYAAALSVAFAQEVGQGVDPAARISLDEDFAPADFGIETVGTLPTSPFYFLKSARRGITSFFTFDPTNKAELSLQYASEKFLEAKTLAEQEGADPADITSALESFGAQLDKATGRIEQAGVSGTDADKDALSEKVMDSVLKYTKSLDGLEKGLPPEAFAKAEETKDKAFTTFGTVGGLVNSEKMAEQIVAVLDEQKGSEFKNFKNVEILKEVKDNVSPAVEGALQVAEDNTLLKLQNELEGLENSQKALFKDFVQGMSGNELRHLEIMNDLEVRPVSADLREAISNAKEETLTRTETRLGQLTQDERSAYLEHLNSGDLEDVRVVKDLENNLKPEIFQNVEGIKKSVTESYAKKFENTDEAGKAKILEKVGQFHDAKSLAIFDEIDALIPADKKGVFDEIKKRAAEEIRKDFERARNVEQQKVILDSLAGDHPEELEAIEWFRGGVDKSYKNVFDNLAQTQFKAIENRAGQISDKDKLAKFESDIKKSESAFNPAAFDWKSIFGSLDEKKKVFDSPNLALEKVRAAEVIVSEFRDVVGTLPLDVAYSDGKFDYAAQEIGRLLDLAERRVEMARTVLGYGDMGRAFGEAEQAAKIARDGLRMAQEYKAGKKKVIAPPPFFLPSVVGDFDGGPGTSTAGGMQLYNEYEFGQYCYYVGGFMKTRMYCALSDGRAFDARGKTFPIAVPAEFIPRYDVVTMPTEGGKCPATFAPSPDFCSKGKIVYDMDQRGCTLSPRCEARQDGDPGPVNPSEPFTCGGIAGFQCPSGYRCQMPYTNVTDAMGKCISETNTCQAYWSGFIYDSVAQKCRAESTSGCRDPFIYHSVEECEKGQTRPIGECPSMPTVDACPAGQKKVVTFTSPSCGTFYGCSSDQTKPTVCPAMPTVDFCPTGQKRVVSFSSPECGSYYMCQTVTTDSSKWVKHFWKFSDGMTTDSMILNRTDSEYSTYINSIETQCSKISKNRFIWRPFAGNDSADNWKNFGIPDCSGTADVATCGNSMCEMSETAQSCPADCGSTASTMKRCFYPNASINGAKLGYGVWCEADYYNCHRETSTGEAMSTTGLSLGVPSSCEGSAPSGGTCSYYTQAACDGDSLCLWSNGWCGAKPHCNDGKDNDSDGQIDYPADTGCSSSSDWTETPDGGTGYVDCTAYKTSSSCVGPQCYWSSSSASCIATSGTTSGGCRNYTSQTSCQSAYCTWYPSHYDGTHCDDAAHGSGTTSTGDMPAAPTALATTKVSSGVRLDWHSSAQNVLKFKILRKMGSSGSPLAVLAEMGISSGTSGPFSYNDTSNPTGTIEYRIQACHATNCSADSNAASITISSTATGTTQCSDGKDNDGDGWIDMGDSGCYGSEDNDEVYVAPTVTPPSTSPTSSTSGTCSSTNSAACTSSTSCAGAGLYWCTPTGYPAGCSTAPCSTSSSTGGSSSMSRCFYPNATINGTPPGYTVWCESDYYNCHKGEPSGTAVSTSGLALGAPSSCESGWSTSSSGTTCNANGTCESTESYQSCPADCGGTSSSSSSCSSTPSYCTTEASCTSYNFYWCNGSCVSNSSMCGSSTSNCSSTGSAGSCTSSSACAGAGYYWCSTYNMCYSSSSGCTSSPTPSPSSSSTSCPSGQWWNGSACVTTTSPPPSGSYTTCNGNNVCDSGETTSSCPSDCH